MLRSVAAAECRAVCGDYAGARTLVEDELALEPVGVDRARLLLQRAQLGDEPADRAIALLQDALANAGDDVLFEAEIRAALTYWITNARRIEDAEPHALRCLELAERSGDVQLLVRALEAVAASQFWLGRGIPAALMERALQLDPLCESMRISQRPTSAFGWMCVWAGDLERARTLLGRARQVGEARADVTVHSVLWSLAALEYVADDWPGAVRVANALYELGVDAEYEPVVIHGLAARSVITAHLGDEDEARRDAEAATRLDERRGSRTAEPFRAWALGILELSLDNPAARAGGRARGDPCARVPKVSGNWVS